MKHEHGYRYPGGVPSLEEALKRCIRAARSRVNPKLGPAYQRGASAAAEAVRKVAERIREESAGP